jgi:hypothetical protein
MNQSKFNQHSSHDVHINWRLTNAHGNPALCCSQCTAPKGPRRGQPLYIDWLKAAHIEELQKLGVEEIF